MDLYATALSARLQHHVLAACEGARWEPADLRGVSVTGDAGRYRTELGVLGGY